MRHKLQRALAAASADVRAVLHRALDRPGRGLGAAESEALLRCRARDDVAGLPDVDEDGARWTGDSYIAIVEAVRRAVPRGVHLHALSPEEVLHGARRSRRPVADFLADARRAGVDSLPGTSAEILDDGVRATLAKGRLTTAEWLDVVETAHAAGLPTTATMMFGHVEDAGHVARHFSTIRALAERTGMVSEFVPLPFVSTEAPMYKDPARRAALGVRGGPTTREALLVHAVARLALDGAVDNLQASWPKVGLGFASTLLRVGANDLGGVLMNESISAAELSSYAELTRRGDWRVRDAVARGRDRRRSGGAAPAAARAESAAPRDVVTYSSCYTVVPTYECFNKCAYCSFRAPIAGGRGDWKSKDDVRADLERVAASGVCEVLVLAGEVGPLLEAEMAALAEVNASMGLMLEQATPALRLPGAPHHRAPSKDPALRMEQLDMAGRLRVPFTTGILCGIGETADDRLRSLDVIAESHARFGHVQECIIQPFSPDPALARFAPGAAPDLPALVAAARARLPAGVVVQVPPNLVKGELERCLRSGARDLAASRPWTTSTGATTSRAWASSRRRSRARG
ncbi:hypothetical protein JL720_11591 [Aureococcus anophagefferens]|nr:hypothetical protein JL720_11591 [Aureococcus anophagefferens]